MIWDNVTFLTCERRNGSITKDLSLDSPRYDILNGILDKNSWLPNKRVYTWIVAREIMTIDLSLNRHFKDKVINVRKGFQVGRSHRSINVNSVLRPLIFKFTGRSLLCEGELCDGCSWLSEPFLSSTTLHRRIYD